MAKINIKRNSEDVTVNIAGHAKARIMPTSK